MTLTYLIIASLMGLFSHYYVRWQQGRTDSTFKEYMLGEWAGTLQSLIANIMSSVGAYLALPDDVGGKLLLGAIYAAYMAGYMFDSALNRDPKPSVPAKPKDEHEEMYNDIKAAVQKKSLADVLADDANL